MSKALAGYQAAMSVALVQIFGVILSVFINVLWHWTELLSLTHICFLGYRILIDSHIYFHVYCTPLDTLSQGWITSPPCLWFPLLWQGSMGHTRAAITHISITASSIFRLLKKSPDSETFLSVKNVITVDNVILDAHSAAAPKPQNVSLSGNTTRYTTRRAEYRCWFVNCQEDKHEWEALSGEIGRE